MRWDSQLLDATDDAALPGMTSGRALLRTFDTPEFRGMQFLEVAARSALNKVPGDGFMAGATTINPYRGCQHACVYCFARNTHTYLDLDAGADFDSRIVVKINIAEVLAGELGRRRELPERVMLGTNTDPYQRAEGRYRLLPKIIRALARHGVGISILTKGSLVRRDLPLLAEAARSVPVDISLSIAIFDDELQQRIEPGTPTTAARLATVRAVRDAGLGCGVLAMPILPGLTDGDDHLDRAFARLAEAGATSATMGPLHLRKGAREWYFAWLRRERGDLVGLYEELYATGAYAAKGYRDELAARIVRARSRHRFERAPGPRGRARPAGPRPRAAPQPAADPLF
ncbi:Rv2578c family radical SAM protein [Naumannella cuiyingiana]|uniref:DNA repair photolyase n=1 Tax=Naumannella cuiyingiana TaxID=1347891 RepID=A0A7Z0IKC6_9ACTN|nr:DNA repair photolyase [Naumannella cuiyingiana]